MKTWQGLIKRHTSHLPDVDMFEGCGRVDTASREAEVLENVFPLTSRINLRGERRERR